MTNNVDRRHRARIAVEAYEETLNANIAQALSEVLSDLLTDLRHFAAFEKLDFEKAVFLSEINFVDECAEAEVDNEGPLPIGIDRCSTGRLKGR